MNYVFGPVPSRRLGQSLGIDNIPLKTCNWNCVYCQLGRTIPLTNRRQVYIPTNTILAEIKTKLSRLKPDEIDWVTFVGSGEPTLHRDLGYLIEQVKSITSLPIAIITNGALLYQTDVRAEIASADAILPSLDAGSSDLYRKINRPHPECSFERLVCGLEALRQEYQGKIWVELMLIKGLNDDFKSLTEIHTQLKRIKPDQVHINLPTRPPAESWVQPSGQDGCQRACTILGDIAQVVHPTKGSFNLSGSKTLTKAIIAIIGRHPLTDADLLTAISNVSPDEVGSIMLDLQRSDKVQAIWRNGKRYWVASATHFPQEK